MCASRELQAVGVISPLISTAEDLTDLSNHSFNLLNDYCIYWRTRGVVFFFFIIVTFHKWFSLLCFTQLWKLSQHNNTLFLWTKDTIWNRMDKNVEFIQEAWAGLHGLNNSMFVFKKSRNNYWLSLIGLAFYLSFKTISFIPFGYEVEKSLYAKIIYI